jgi:hypothetical protein
MNAVVKENEIALSLMDPSRTGEGRTSAVTSQKSKGRYSISNNFQWHKGDDLQFVVLWTLYADSVVGFVLCAPHVDGV